MANFVISLASSPSVTNRALGLGYPVSALHLGAGQSGWCPPLALARPGPRDDANAVAAKQIESLLRDKTLPFEQELCLLPADSRTTGHFAKWGDIQASLP